MAFFGSRQRQAVQPDVVGLDAHLPLDDDLAVAGRLGRRSIGRACRTYVSTHAGYVPLDSSMTVPGAGLLLGLGQAALDRNRPARHARVVLRAGGHDLLAPRRRRGPSASA